MRWRCGPPAQAAALAVVQPQALGCCTGPAVFETGSQRTALVLAIASRLAATLVSRGCPPTCHAAHAGPALRRQDAVHQSFPHQRRLVFGGSPGIRVRACSAKRKGKGDRAWGPTTSAHMCGCCRCCTRVRARPCAAVPNAILTARARAHPPRPRINTHTHTHAMPNFRLQLRAHK